MPLTACRCTAFPSRPVAPGTSGCTSIARSRRSIRSPLRTRSCVRRDRSCRSCSSIFGGTGGTSTRSCSSPTSITPRPSACRSCRSARSSFRRRTTSLRCGSVCTSGYSTRRARSRSTASRSGAWCTARSPTSAFPAISSAWAWMYRRRATRSASVRGSGSRGRICCISGASWRARAARRCSITSGAGNEAAVRHPPHSCLPAGAPPRWRYRRTCGSGTWAASPIRRSSTRSPARPRSSCRASWSPCRSSRSRPGPPGARSSSTRAHRCSAR